MQEVKLTRGQIEDRRLEIENRIRNLFWTISGDYSLEIKPDIYGFGLSKYIPLYDAIKQGAFAKYFDPEALAVYIMKKVHLGAKEKPLMELTQLCIDVVDYPLIKRERKGIDQIRKECFRALLKNYDKKASDTVFTRAKNVMMQEYLQDPVSDVDEEAKCILASVMELEGAASTDEIIEKIDCLYNTDFDRSFEEKKGNLKQVLDIDSRVLYHAVEQEALSDEQMDHILKKFISNLRRDMLRLQVSDDARKTGPPLTREMIESINFAPVTDESAQRVRDYVQLSYGRPLLSPAEENRCNALFCRGIHRGCALHFTEGILHNPLKKNNQYRYSQMLTEKNRMYYYGNHRVIKRNIANLADSLEKMLVLRREKESWRDRSGQLIPSRLWKLGRTDDDKLFDKTNPQDDSEFVVDILLDGSGSQMKRQNQVSAQGYIISEALSVVGIPHRVMSFCTFWDYTVMHRFRDYDDDAEQNRNIFEYQASASNRDGLAIRAAYETLLERNEEHKILIVLSDGHPSDIGRNSQGKGKSMPYVGEEAVRDTAYEVRKARAADVMVLGIFAGSIDDLEVEKKIYGSDFAYIRKLDNFSQVVGNYLMRQIGE